MRQPFSVQKGLSLSVTLSGATSPKGRGFIFIYLETMTFQTNYSKISAEPQCSADIHLSYCNNSGVLILRICKSFIFAKSCNH